AGGLCYHPCSDAAAGGAVVAVHGMADQRLIYDWQVVDEACVHCAGNCAVEKWRAFAREPEYGFNFCSDQVGNGEICAVNHSSGDSGFWLLYFVVVVRYWLGGIISDFYRRYMANNMLGFQRHGGVMAAGILLLLALLAGCSPSLRSPQAGG